jgi:hypothetical protein
VAEMRARFEQLLHGDDRCRHKVVPFRLILWEASNPDRRTCSDTGDVCFPCGVKARPLSETLRQIKSGNALDDGTQ